MKDNVVSYPEPREPEWVDDMDKRIEYGIQNAWERGMVEAGSPVVVVTGWRAGAGYTNTCRIINVPESAEKSIYVVRQQEVEMP